MMLSKKIYVTRNMDLIPTAGVPVGKYRVGPQAGSYLAYRSEDRFILIPCVVELLLLSKRSACYVEFFRLNRCMLLS